MSFSHYIICRYNLTLFSSNVYKVKDPHGWMERRRYYFDWLVMSLGVQTCKNFHFVLLMDAKTPSEYVQDLDESISRATPDYEIFFGNPKKWLAQKEIKSDWLITSRIDCDDYYNEGFVEAIQSEFKAKTEVLDVYGLQYDEKTEDFYTSGRIGPNSPFISLVEPTQGAVTVFEKQHTYMPQKYNARFVGGQPLYIQVIHDENISNKIIGQKL